MRLTNQQIDALVNKAEKNFNEKNKKEKFTHTNEQIKECTRYSEIILSIPEKIRNKLDLYTSNYNVKSILETLYPEKVTNKFNRREVFDKIVLASIDSKTMDELCSKVVELK